MYFDNAFPRPDFMQDYLRDFMNRHRSYPPLKKNQIKIEEAVRLYGVSWKHLKEMNRRELTQLYRKLALKYQPDHGGGQETFVKISEIYQGLRRKK